MKRKNKGFTLIELLAVIVILGLLMAIAIPSVTKYITQSRKKTLTTTIGNYASALVSDVNNMEYVFTEENIIYAVPIECIEVERGGNNPFGKWSPATENHWAYVLVQYDDTTSSYTYGFTFKDSAGYGLYPTTTEKLDENGVQIQTDLNLNKPESGTYLNVTDKKNWESSGFIINDNTMIRLYESKNGLCDTKKYCKGTGKNIGDIITCGSEKFHIIENNNSTITIITKYGLKLDVTNPIQVIGSGNSIGYANIENCFSNISSFPAYIYNENSNAYQYIEAYKKYLNNNGIRINEAKLISYEQLLNLGCSSNSCANSLHFNWLNNGGYWYTGTVSNTSRLPLVVVTSNGKVSNHYCNYPMQVRPIITMDINEVIFN